VKVPCEKCGHPRPAVGIGDSEIRALIRERDSLSAALSACLDRLDMVSDDSEIMGFIESCEPVIAQAKAALKSPNQ
jgi:hypothetical protein